MPSIPKLRGRPGVPGIIAAIVLSAGACSPAGQATVTPATPTTEPPPAALPVTSGPLDPGMYYVDDPARTPVRFTFTLPAGWSGRLSDLSVSKHSNQAGEMGFSSSIVAHVYADACRSEGTLTEVGPTADDLVQALLDQDSSDASEPEDISLGGYPGKLIRMSVPADLDTATCRHPEVLIQIWADEPETEFFAIPVDPPETESTAYIVDVDGERVVILAGYAPDTSAADIAEFEGIIESIEFAP